MSIAPCTAAANGSTFESVGRVFAYSRPLDRTPMKHTHLSSIALIGLLAFTTPPAAAAPDGCMALHDPAPAVEDSKAAAARVMAVLINDGLIAGEEAAKLRDEIAGIFAKTPLTGTGDAAKDAAAKKKVKDQVQTAVLRHVGKDKSTRVAELLAKPESWEAKACAKGKACCAGHK